MKGNNYSSDLAAALAFVPAPCLKNHSFNSRSDDIGLPQTNKKPEPNGYEKMNKSSSISQLCLPKGYVSVCGGHF